MTHVMYAKTRCPRCESRETSITKVRRYPAITVRYHRCRACGCRFVSREYI